MDLSPLKKIGFKEQSHGYFKELLNGERLEATMHGTKIEVQIFASDRFVLDANLVSTVDQAIVWFKKYIPNGYITESAIMEAAPSFAEKRGLQKTIQSNLKTLAGAGLSFTDKRNLQKEITAAFAKLNEKVEIPEPQPATLADVNKVMPLIRNFIGKSQLSAIGDGIRGEEGQFFKDKFIELAKFIEGMPKSYDTDGQGDKAVAYLHYFSGGSDWYITEKDKGSPDDENPGQQQQAFGYAILNGDKEMAELGYISIQELIDAGVELDLYWTPKSLEEIKGKDEKGDGRQDDSGPDIEAMKNAVIDHGGALVDVGTAFVSFTLNDRKGNKTGIAQLSFNEAEKKYRVFYGENGENNTGFFADPDSAVGVYAAVVEDTVAPLNGKLSDLIAGKFNSEPPEKFLDILQEIIKETGDVQPVIPPTITYIEANQDKISAVMESAIKEVFGGLWGKVQETEMILEAANGFPLLKDWRKSGNMMTVEVGKAKYTSVKTAGGDSFTLSVEAGGERKNIYPNNDPEAGWFKTANDAVKAAKQYHQSHF